MVINIERYGNTTAATIPLALADAARDGRLKKGDLVLLASVGAGFTVGADAAALGRASRAASRRTVHPRHEKTGRDLSYTSNVHRGRRG